MTQEITFIHAADLHLDSPFQGLAGAPEKLFQAIKDSTFTALDNLIEKAVAHRVDFVLITGDLFDHEKQSLKAQICLRQAFEQLASHDIEVFLSYGNHDYRKGNVHQVEYPNNVHIFPDEEVRTFLYEKNGRPAAQIYGFSYVDRAVTKNKAKEFVVKDAHVPFHIAMLHGSVQGNAEHDVYAPFQLSDLSSKGFNYWALGHIHKRQVLKEDPYVVYPGNIQGRHRKETGEKGCYLVHLTRTKTNLTFLPLQNIEFTTMEVDVSDINEIFQLEPRIIQRAERIAKNALQLVDLKLHSDTEYLSDWQADGSLDEMLAIINESLASQEFWQFIYKMEVRLERASGLADNTYGEHFLAELKKRFNETSGEAYVAELYQHRQARKFLELPEEDIKNEWKREAEEQLFSRLLKGEKR